MSRTGSERPDVCGSEQNQEGKQTGSVGPTGPKLNIIISMLSGRRSARFCRTSGRFGPVGGSLAEEEEEEPSSKLLREQNRTRTKAVLLVQT